MDKEAKICVLCCSLRWLAGMLPSHHSTIPLLQNPLSPHGTISRELVARLTEHSVYSTVLSRVLPGEKADSFSSLIHILARHGVYILERDSLPVTSALLSQRKPFREAGHVAVMEGLMCLYMHSMISLPHVVRTLRRVSQLVASKDLPAALPEALLLWISKITQAVKLQPLTSPNCLVTALRDGLSIPALLLYYAPNAFKPTDFHCGQSLTTLQISENLNKATCFLRSYLERPGFHISPTELKHSADLLESNVLALVTLLYHNLEVLQPIQKVNHVLKNRLTLHSTSDSALSKHAHIQNRAPLKHSLTALQKSSSSHELITADHLLVDPTSQPQLSIQRSHRKSQEHSDIELRRSFTIGTQHSLPSAIAAGLPVITCPAVDEEPESLQTGPIHLTLYQETEQPVPSAELGRLRQVYQRIEERDKLAEQNWQDNIGNRVLEQLEAPTDNLGKASTLSNIPFSPISPLDAAQPRVSNGHVIPEASHVVSETFEGKAYGMTVENPWSVISAPVDDLLWQRRGQEVRARLEERERLRKTSQRKTIDVLSCKEGTPSILPDKQETIAHNGPDIYVRPQAKSNKKLIRNALSFVCLAGEANLNTKQSALAELDNCSAGHIMVLFRDIIGFKFRGLYSYSSEAEQVHKLFGSGPKVIKSSMVAHLYKYNSGRKEFRQIPSRTFSMSVDALTIQSEYWTQRKLKTFGK